MQLTPVERQRVRNPSPSHPDFWGLFFSSAVTSREKLDIRDLSESRPSFLLVG